MHPEAVAGRRIHLSLVFYGLLAAAALGWGALRGDLDLYHHPEPWVGLAFPASTGAALGSGVVVALVVIFTTRVLVRHTTWARKLHMEFRSLLGPLSGGEIAVFALTSGIAEEMLFRGYLMTALNGRARQWARVALPALAFTALRAVRFLPGPDLGPVEWMGYIFGVALPLGLWWGLMRELAGGAIWPGLISHFLLELGPILVGKSPALP